MSYFCTIKSCLRLIIFSAISIYIVAPTQARTLNSAAEPDYPPLSLKNQKGLADGFSVELLTATLKAVNHDIKFKVDFWSIIKQELVDDKLDVLPLVGRTPER